MKVLVLSDTHGTFARTFDPNILPSIDLCVFCGDCLESDLACLAPYDIPKIWVEGNHPSYEGGSKQDVFGKYGITDISWKAFEFRGTKFFGIPGKMSYVVLEDVSAGTHRYPVMNPKISETIREFEDDVRVFREARPNVVVSHFPAFGIMDGESLSHRGLRFLREAVESPSGPEWLLHGHLHSNEEREIGWTKVVQTFGMRILEIQ